MSSNGVCKKTDDKLRSRICVGKVVHRCKVPRLKDVAPFKMGSNVTSGRSLLSEQFVAPARAVELAAVSLCVRKNGSCLSRGRFCE